MRPTSVAAESWKDAPTAISWSRKNRPTSYCLDRSFDGSSLSTQMTSPRAFSIDQICREIPASRQNVDGFQHRRLPAVVRANDQIDATQVPHLEVTKAAEILYV